jgi:hypothetical protein
MGTKQKIILGILAGLILVTGGALAYLKFFNKSNTVTEVDTSKEDDTNVDNAVNGQPGRVTDAPAFFPTLSYNGNDLWYFTSDGKLMKLILPTGVKQEYILPYSISPTSVYWAPRGDNFIAEIVSGSAKKVLFYNASTKSFVEYPAAIKHANFMPDGTHVAYNWVDDKGLSTISVADFDTKGFKKVADMPEGNLGLQASPSGKGLFAYNLGNPASHTLHYIDFENNKTIPIKTSQNNMAIWSPDGKKFVFNKFDPNASGPNSVLWLGDITGSASSDKKIALSAPVNKAVFDTTGKYLYIAVPEADGDGLWRYDVSSGEKRQLYKPNDFKIKTTFSNMIPSPDGKWVYYVNADGYVYGVNVNK